ncbi:MAG: hypothetical protein OXC68_09630 [Aestuariivita sp.]|nr:hypothetical protein [Aestuariivita sp.]
MFDREGLEAYLQQSEGEKPPVFKGRQDILATLRDCGEKTRKFIQEPSHTNPQLLLRGIPKTTQIVQGAPGAGKSSLLAKLQEDCDDAGNEKAPRVIIVSSQSIVGSLPQVLKLVRVAGELSSSKWKEVLARIGFNLSANSLGDISAAVSWNGADMEIPSTLDRLAEESPGQKWMSPVILAVDESQRFKGGEDTPHAQFLQSIHDASSGLPLTLVLAGLSDTKDIAIDMGLTRGLTTHNIHCLNKAECAELMVEFCQKFKVDVAGYEPLLQELARPTEGWPRHLHFTFRALAKELVQVNGVVGDVNWTHVGTISARGRVAYYQHQQSPILRALKPLIGEVMQDLKKGGSSTDIIDCIDHYLTRDMCKYLPPKKRGIAFEFLPYEIYKEMIHQGAIQEYEPDQFFSPIPSFRGHLIKEGIMDPSNPNPPRHPFKLYDGTILNEERDGFASYAEARSWALKKLEHMSDAEDISLWYGAIALETLRAGTSPSLKPGDGRTTSLNL